MIEIDDTQPTTPRGKTATPAGNGTPGAVRPAGTAPKRRRTPAPPPPPPKTSLSWVAGVALAILALDQITKLIVVQVLNLPEVQAIDIFDPWLNLRMAWNQGVNFGLFSSDVNVMRWVLIAIAAVICIWLTVWLVRIRPGKLAQIAAGLLIGGALGNVIDRIAYGAVADFLNMSLPGWRNPYSFNVADIAIFAGALGLVFQPGPPSEPEPTGKGKTTTGKAASKSAPSKPGPIGKATPKPAPTDKSRDKVRDDTRKTR